MPRPFRSPRALMVQGTTSGAGKSTLVAGLCRHAARAGLVVAPFKPQNMSLNSAVASDGGEIGRAQALQAIAARVAPTTDMNPILLKPSSDTRAQVVVHGRPLQELDAVGFQAWKPKGLRYVMESFGRLASAHDAVVVEGAGSPAEVNLRENDLANMGFAEAADCPVLLVADIDRGGVFAHLVGTLDCLSPSERARVVGFVINRFRGDPVLLEPGLRWLEERTGKPVLGVIPFLPGLDLDAEDALPEAAADRRADAFRVVVPALPRISNHTDFDALRAHASVRLRFVGPGEALPPADLLILPGSKNVRGDLAFLVQQGWGAQLLRHLRYGGRVLGICGGLQMLGRAIHDPAGIEGPAGSSAGLGLLDFETTLEREKVLQNVRGILFPDSGRAADFAGYEIHQGRSDGPAFARPMTQIDARREGALSEDGLVAGTYVHGILDQPRACAALLDWAGLPGRAGVDRDARREAALERLADAVEQHLDFARLDAVLEWPPKGRTSA